MTLSPLSPNAPFTFAQEQREPLAEAEEAVAVDQVNNEKEEDAAQNEELIDEPPATETSTTAAPLLVHDGASSPLGDAQILQELSPEAAREHLLAALHRLDVDVSQLDAAEVVSQSRVGCLQLLARLQSRLLALQSRLLHDM